MQLRGSAAVLPAIGMLAGLLLLVFAGVILVTPPSSLPTVAGSGGFLQRRLGNSFGYITSTRPPSSFDSSDSSSSSDYSLEPSKSFESGSLDSSDWNILFPKISASIGSTMGPLTAWLILQVFFACLYNKVVADPIKETGSLDERMENMQGMETQTDFNNNIFECYKDKWVCMQGLFCPMVRIAHTNAASGVCAFWETLWCYCCCSWLTLGMGPSCLIMWWRLRTKNVMRVEENVMSDFCITMLCPLISLCQMSTAVDSAMGYQVTGCCEYTPYSYGGGDMQ